MILMATVGSAEADDAAIIRLAQGVLDTGDPPYVAGYISYGFELCEHLSFRHYPEATTFMERYATQEGAERGMAAFAVHYRVGDKDDSCSAAAALAVSVGNM
ncbi:MAG: hypothetical protein ACSHW1_17235 [Yoonia sp.]